MSKLLTKSFVCYYVGYQMNMNKAEKTCYMCEELATSVEHIPPQCLFPEQKDLPDGIDLRKQLLTVPSCDKHNSKKSQDD